MINLDPENLPGFNTYNESLAKCKGCTKRTIINHRERLINAGFITREEHSGQGGVEIWLNPEVLGLAKLSTTYGDNVVKIGDVASLFYEKAKNFHPLVHEQQEQLNNNSKVDKSGTLIMAIMDMEFPTVTRVAKPQEQDMNKTRTRRKMLTLPQNSK